MLGLLQTVVEKLQGCRPTRPIPSLEFLPFDRIGQMAQFSANPDWGGLSLSGDTLAVAERRYAHRGRVGFVYN